MELTHSTRLSRAISRIRCVFDSGSPFQSWLKQSMSLPRKGSAATVAGAFLIATFPFFHFFIQLLPQRHRDTETKSEGQKEMFISESSPYLSRFSVVSACLCGRVFRRR